MLSHVIVALALLLQNFIELQIFKYLFEKKHTLTFHKAPCMQAIIQYVLAKGLFTCRLIQILPYIPLTLAYK